MITTPQEANAIARCLKAYSRFAVNEKVIKIGVNRKAGYAYIMLSNGVKVPANIQ